MKVNYFKKWGNDGTCYTQTITINKDIMFKFNNYVKKEKNKLNNKKIYSNDEMRILYYLETLESGINYTTLTTLRQFIYFYSIYISKKDKNFKRILYRNTIINVI